MRINKYLMALVGFLCLGYVAHFWYLQHGHIDFMTDSSISSICAFSFVSILSSFNLHIDSFQTLYMPLQTMLASNLLYLTGSYSWLTFIINSFYLIILVAAIYLIGKEIGSSLSGYCSALLVLLYPYMFFTYHVYSLDLPLTAVVTLTLFCLLKSQFFENLYWSFAFSGSLIWGLMIKDPAGAFIVGPFIISFIIAVLSSLKLRNFRRILNLILSGCAIIFVFYRFYLQNNYFSQITLPGITHEGDAGDTGGSLNITWLLGSHLTPVFIILFLAGLAIIHYRRTAFRWHLLLWIIIPYAMVALMPHWKSVRQVLPSYPAFAVISSFAVVWVIEKLKEQRARIVFMIFFVMLGVVQIFDLTYTRKLLSVQLGRFRYFTEDGNSIIDLKQRKINEAGIILSYNVIKSLGMPSVGIMRGTEGELDSYFFITKYASLNGIKCRDQGSELIQDDLEDQLKDISLLLFVFQDLPSEGTSLNNFLSFEHILERYNNNFASGNLNLTDNKKIALKKKKWESFIGRFEPLQVLYVYGRTFYFYGSKTRH
ncbi:MAG: hypothetical protein LHV68_10830 [Elusimicrobia bacterium]|nr:hypothetical protein [Candidatus Liberimonas magnetica]